MTTIGRLWELYQYIERRSQDSDAVYFRHGHSPLLMKVWRYGRFLYVGAETLRGEDIYAGTCALHHKDPGYTGYEIRALIHSLTGATSDEIKLIVCLVYASDTYKAWVEA